MKTNIREAFHFGMVVDDMASAMADLGSSLNLTFAPVEHRIIVLRYRGEVITTPLSFTYSHQGPVHLELIGAVSGTPWEEPNQMHHVGYWVEDLSRSIAELTSGGMTVEVTYDDPSGDPTGFAYMSGPGGHRVELVEARRREMMESWISGEHAFPEA